MNVRFSKVAFLAFAACSAVAVRGAVVLKNADWATIAVVTNGMCAAHDQFPADTTNFTVEAWVKPSANVKQNGTYGNWIYANMGGGNGRFIFHIYGGRLCSFHASPRDWYEATGSAGVIPLNVWTHVAMARTKTAIKFYVNGEFVSETNAASGGTFLAAPVNGSQTIGNQHSGLNNGENASNDHVFQGRISDMRVWTVERTEQEIRDNYRKRLRGNEEHLFTYVPFTDAHDGMARNWVDGYNLIVPPQQELVEDTEIDAQFTETPALPPFVSAQAFHSTHLSGNGHAITADIRLSSVEFTVETWIRPDWHHDTGPVYWLGQYRRNDPGWLGLAFAHGSLRPALFIGNSSVSRAYATDGGIPIHEWTHVAIARDHGTVTIYTNGLLAATRTVNSANAEAAPPDEPLTLAVAAPDGSSGNLPFEGCLREFRIWGAVRTAEQISANFAKKLTGKEAGLLGYWPMDEGYGTNVFNKVPGAAAAMDNVFTWAPDRFLRVTDTQTGISTDARLTDDFTLETWVRVPALPKSRGYIMGQWKSGYNPSWVTLSFDGQYVPGLRIGSDGATTNATHFFSAGVVTTNTWFHLAATREGSSVKVYRNGVLVTQGTYACDDAMPPVNLSLFALNNSLGMVGDTCEMRAWNRARTAQEIVRDMNRPLIGNESGLIGYWPCSQAAGSASLQDWKSNSVRALSESQSLLPGDGVPRLSGDAEHELAPSGDGTWSGVMRTGVGIDVQDFTFETWVYPTAFPSGKSSNRESLLFSQWKNGGDAHRFLIGLFSVNHFGVLIGESGWRISASGVPLNRWTHLAAAREGSTLRLYVNGELDSTFENFSTLSPWSETAQLKLTLGGTDDKYLDDYSRTFHGAMREVRVWNRACSAEEIAANYKSRLHGTEAGLIGYWPLTETSGNVLANACRRGGAPGPNGFMVAGWDYVDTLELADPPKGTMILFR